MGKPREASNAPSGAASAGSANSQESPDSPENLEELGFEDALARLETIVDRLEQGDLELEQALAAFEQGVALTRRCAGQLEDAERRIEVLVREGEKWIARPFEEAEETG
jgi:exodeoxyribonuclease VII small subunit